MNVSYRNMLIRPLNRRVFPGEVTYENVLSDTQCFVVQPSFSYPISGNKLTLIVSSRDIVNLVGPV